MNKQKNDNGPHKVNFLKVFLMNVYLFLGMFRNLFESDTLNQYNLFNEFILIKSSSLIGFPLSDQECTWNIQASSNQYVHLQITHFDLVASPQCTKDYLLIKEGSSSGTRLGPNVGNTNIFENYNMAALGFSSDPLVALQNHEIGR